MVSFLDRTGIEGVFPNINDEGGDLWRRYGVSYQPAFVFIAADGTMSSTGGLGEDGIQNQINSTFG